MGFNDGGIGDDGVVTVDYDSGLVTVELRQQEYVSCSDGGGIGDDGAMTVGYKEKIVCMLAFAPTRDSYSPTACPFYSFSSTDVEGPRSL
ncbi:hypothetical protein TIFTF001_006342 [Ficus carica]|uniref:Uncharacterized protein n=1 Tax=Ficus carica TaxID=3494 RepID=A0AA88CYM1_FICCA|nr:hypothetical protein TIFTF001_006342 [Ficus carica]